MSRKNFLLCLIFTFLRLGNATTTAMNVRKQCYNMMKERMAPYGFTRCNYEGNQYCKVAKGGWLAYRVMAIYSHNCFTFDPRVGFRSNICNALQAHYFADNRDVHRRISPGSKYLDRLTDCSRDVRRAITTDFDLVIDAKFITGGHYGWSDLRKEIYTWEEEKVPEAVDFYMDIFRTYGAPFLSQIKSVQDLERFVNEPMVSLSLGQLIADDHPFLSTSFSIVAWHGILLAYIANREAYEVIREAYKPAVERIMNKTTFAYGYYHKLLDLLDTEEFRQRADQLIKKHGYVMPTIEVG